MKLNKIGMLYSKYRCNTACIFPHAFFPLVYTVSYFVFIGCRYKYTLVKLTILQMAPCRVITVAYFLVFD